MNQIGTPTSFPGFSPTRPYEATTGKRENLGTRLIGKPVSERLSRSFCLARPGISPLERLWNGFGSDAELFMYRTYCLNYYNVFCRQFDRNEHFSPLRDKKIYWKPSTGRSQEKEMF